MAKASTKAPDQTLEEIKYLKALIEKQTPVRVKLTDNTVVRGQVEYYDRFFLRITRPGEANLFIFKKDIKYLMEDGEGSAA